MSTTHQLFRLLFAPGIIAHEVMHVLACRLADVEIKSVVLFQLSGQPGYVTHSRPESFLGAVFIAFAPVIGLVTAVPLALALASTRLLASPVADGILRASLVWVAWTATVFTLPSEPDIEVIISVIWSRVYRWPLAVAVYPVYYLRKLIARIGYYPVMIPLATAVVASWALVLYPGTQPLVAEFLTRRTTLPAPLRDRLVDPGRWPTPTARTREILSN